MSITKIHLLRQFAMVTLVFFVYIIIRYIYLINTNIDPDELFSIELANAPFQGIWGAAAADVSHPPLFYYFLKSWQLVGGVSLDWTRLLPLVMTTLALPAIWKTSRLCGLSPYASCGVILFIAGNTFLIGYTIYLRSFVALFLTSSYQFWSLFRILKIENPSWLDWFLLLVTSCAVVYSHYWGWLLLLSELGVVAALTRSRCGRVVVVGVLTGIAYAPWILSVLAAVQSRGGDGTSQIGWIEKPGAKSVVAFFVLLNGAPPIRYLGLVGLTVATGVITTALVRSTRGLAARPQHLIAIGWILVVVIQPIVTFIASVTQSQSVWAIRSMISVVVPYAVLLFCSINLLPTGPPVRAGIAVVAACWGLGCGLATVSGPPVKVNYRGITHAIRSKEQPAASPIVVYTQPFHVGVLSFLGNLEEERALDVRTSTTMTGLPREHIWVVLSSYQWTGPPIEEQLINQGFVIEYSFSVATRGETMWAFSVRPHESSQR